MKTDEEAANEITQVATFGPGFDPEQEHADADRLVVGLLDGLGYSKTAQAWRDASHKWWWA